MAIDRDTLVREALNGHGSPSQGPLWPHNWAFDPATPGLSFDPKLAMSQLKGRAVRGTGAGKRFQFTCLVPADAVYERIALAVKRQFAQIDVDMVVEEASLDRLASAISSRTFEAALVEGVGGPW